ncbi:hypothetical protein JTE90_001774 [Oedothorax gibbosus]|uniref:Secreted protein n=1 Tax=Oedothorax gibbosus TaxID=931172 RepID=A0AAV6VQP5_9ARAC|nr:hypothetical protein JTE90_001774 [Oedothorax gibbosus]
MLGVTLVLNLVLTTRLIGLTSLRSGTSLVSVPCGQQIWKRLLLPQFLGLPLMFPRVARHLDLELKTNPRGQDEIVEKTSLARSMSSSSSSSSNFLPFN